MTNEGLGIAAVIAGAAVGVGLVVLGVCLESGLKYLAAAIMTNQR